jgi:hypothetical protein
MPKTLSFCWTQLFQPLLQTPCFEEGEDCTMAIHCQTIPDPCAVFGSSAYFCQKISTQNDIVLASL